MIFIRKSFLYLAGLILLPIFLYGQNQSSLKQKADSLYNAYEDKQALELYLEILEKDPDNFTALWRASFLYSRVGNRFEDEDDQKEYFNKAIEVGKRALDIDSTHTQSNLVMSVAMGRKAIISGARERVAASRAIKKYAERALEYDSTNAGAWHVLGRWNFKVANLSWVERAAANTLFGGLSGNASTQKAAEYIEKAISLDDKHVLYYYDLAKVYEEMDKNQQAVNTCKKAIALPEVTPDDQRIKKGCQKLIDDLL